jgi:hypothetical protein
MCTEQSVGLEAGPVFNDNSGVEDVRAREGFTRTHRYPPDVSDFCMVRSAIAGYVDMPSYGHR